jgi:cytochrome c
VEDIDMNVSQKVGISLGVSLALTLLSPLGAAAEVTTGAALFREHCGHCHSLEAGVNKIGPSLHNVIGRQAAEMDDYDYSSVMKASGLMWTEDTLVKFISGPQAMIPCHQVFRKALVACMGTKMTFPGFQNEESSKAVVDYLKSLQ